MKDIFVEVSFTLSMLSITAGHEHHCSRRKYIAKYVFIELVYKKQFANVQQILVNCSLKEQKYSTIA